MVYLQLAENVLAEQRKVRIKDVSKVVADNPDLKNKIEKLVLMNFSTGSKGQQVISILDIIEEIKKNCDEEVSITNLGQPNVTYAIKTGHLSRNRSRRYADHHRNSGQYKSASFLKNRKKSPYSDFLLNMEIFLF